MFVFLQHTHTHNRSFLKLDQAFLQTGQHVGYVKIFDLEGCSMSQVRQKKKGSSSHLLLNRSSSKSHLTWRAAH